MCAVTPSSAGIKKLHQWAEVWIGNAGSTITVRKNQGFLDIMGKDSASIYTITCIVSENDASKCLGQGMNHSANFRFLYESTLKFEDGVW